MYVAPLLSAVVFIYLGLKVRYEEDISKLLPSDDSTSDAQLAFGSLKVKDKRKVGDAVASVPHSLVVDPFYRTTDMVEVIRDGDVLLSVRAASRNGGVGIRKASCPEFHGRSHFHLDSIHDTHYLHAPAFHVQEDAEHSLFQTSHRMFLWN